MMIITYNGNSCQHCPAGSNDCGRHTPSIANQSINQFTTRIRIGNWNPQKCERMYRIDLHWMKCLYEDSYCIIVDQLVDAGAFTIERHALQISQPAHRGIRWRRRRQVWRSTDWCAASRESGSRLIRTDQSTTAKVLAIDDVWVTWTSMYRPNTPKKGNSRLRRGNTAPAFWWRPVVEWNEMGTACECLYERLSTRMLPCTVQYRYLVRQDIICQWRRREYEIRRECGLLEPPIEGNYLGCLFNTQTRTTRTQSSTQKENNDGRQTVFTREEQTIPKRRRCSLLQRERHKDDPDRSQQDRSCWFEWEWQ